MNYEEILQTVRGFCAREKLLDGKKHLALAVSGGADSMALLCLMRPLAEEKGIALTVCHVNHGLRGETADRDEAFVREVCARLGLPLRVFHAAELEAEAGKPRAGEDWARRLRYACFERVLADGIDAGGQPAQPPGLSAASALPDEGRHRGRLPHLRRTLGHRRDQRRRRLRPQPSAPRRTARPLRGQQRR